MKNTDARKLNQKSLTDLRTRAVSQVQSGQSPELVTKVLGISRQSIYNWLSLYRHGGWDALNAKKRGGRKRKIDEKALKWIYKTVTEKNPLQLKFPFALWTATIIAELMEKRYGVTLSRWSITRLLAQMGLTPQKPIWKSYMQDPTIVDKWLKKILKLSN